MKGEISLEYLDHRINRASRILGDCAGLVRDLDLNRQANIRRIGESPANIYEIQRQVYQLRPDLMPEWLKPGANVRGHG